MKINEQRLKERFDAINGLAVTEEGGKMRLALNDADKAGRDLLVSWFEEAGMDGYLKKPVDTEELFRVLTREFDKLQ